MAYHRTATCHESSAELCGSLPVSEHTAFVKRLHAVIAEKEDLKRRDSAMKGFQRTPAFVLSLVLQMLQGSASVQCTPRGGYSDVCQHTGHDAARDAAWPLVREVFRVGGGLAGYER